jgi:mannose-1-phosphate guanylyltransferase
MPIATSMILAAGVGSRLAPLTEWCPKALMPVGDRPKLAHLALALRAAGIRKIVVNAHHRADELTKLVRDSKHELGEIGVSEERDLLGTAGGVAKARALLGEGDTLIWNADIVAQIDLAALGRSHDERHAGATLVVKIAEKNAGNVGVDGHGKIVRLRKETTAHGEIAGGFFLGVHVIGQELRELLPEVGCLIGDVYLPALRRGDTLRTFMFDGDFADIGTPASYLEANLAWLAARQLSSWRGERTHIEKTVELRNSILGDGARVTGVGMLESCVVWPGTTLALKVDHHRAIMTASGEVPVWGTE